MKDIVSIHDQHELDLQENFRRIDELVDDAVERGTVEPVVNYIYNLRIVSELIGKGLARFLYRVKQNWDKFIESDSDDFKDYMAAVVGLHPHTVERYVRIAKLLEEAPQEYVPKLETMNTDELFPVANANDQGWYLDDDDWKDYLNATTPGERREIIREVKGKPPKKTGLSLWLDRRGSLWVFQSEYDRQFIGSLEIDSEKDVVKKAINRIIKESGIREE